MQIFKVTATAAWWAKLTPAQKRKYIKENPNSKYAPGHKTKTPAKSKPKADLPVKDLVKALGGKSTPAGPNSNLEFYAFAQIREAKLKFEKYTDLKADAEGYYHFKDGSAVRFQNNKGAANRSGIRPTLQKGLMVYYPSDEMKARNIRKAEAKEALEKGFKIHDDGALTLRHDFSTFKLTAWEVANHKQEVLEKGSTTFALNKQGYHAGFYTYRTPKPGEDSIHNELTEFLGFKAGAVVTKESDFKD